MKEKGLDTSKAESALASFNEQIAAAERESAQGAPVLGTQKPVIKVLSTRYAAVGVNS